MILQNLSIKRKLTLITMLTSSLALILSSVSFLIYDLVSFRHLLTQDLMTPPPLHCQRSPPKKTSSLLSSIDPTERYLRTIFEVVQPSHRTFLPVYRSKGTAT